MLIVSLSAIDTVPVRPPPELPLPLVPVIYEQTAEYRGLVVGENQTGAWQLARTFAGPGFKESQG